MAYVRNILFFGSKCCRSNKKRIFSSCYDTKKLFSAISNLEYRFCVNVLLQSSTVVPSKGFSDGKLVCDGKPSKHSFQANKMFLKFKHLHLENLIEYSKDFNESALVALFHKMCVVYHLNKFDTKFLKNLPHLLETNEFKAFCTLLEQKLPRLPPDVLVFLLNLKLFKVPVNCILMRKILTLILENFNCLSLCDILDLYIELSDNYFENIEEAKNIKEVCQVYFEKAFEDELSHCVLYNDLVFFLSVKKLPDNIRKLIAERLLEFLYNSNFRPLINQRFFHFLFDTPFFPSLKERAFNIFKDILHVNFSSKILKYYSSEYRIAVSKSKDYYDEEICKIIAENALKHKNLCNDVITCMEELCFMGYFHEDLFNHILHIILDCGSSKWNPESAYRTASVLSLVNFHEMNNPNLNRIREILLSYNAEEAFSKNFFRFLKWTEYLTFLGCDTRNLLSKIFSCNSGENLKSHSNAECRSIVQLHHFAKEHFSDGYVKLSDDILDLYLKKATFPITLYSPTHLVEFLGGEDYVVQNCTTSQKYFITLAVILGPDNKPINLSSAKAAFEKTSENSKNKSHDIVNDNLKIEDISKPPNSKVITFIGYSDFQPLKFRNVPMASGMAQIVMKSYRSLQYDSVLLPLKLLKSHPEEAVKYLESQIDEIIKKPCAQTIKN